MCTANKLKVGKHTKRAYGSFGFSFHDAPWRVGTRTQHDGRASTKHTQDPLVNCAQAEMTGQNSQLLSQSHAPADPGGRVPKAGVPKHPDWQASSPLTQVPAAEAVAVAGPRGAGRALPLTLSRLAASATARTLPGPGGSATQRARDRPSSPPLPRCSEAGGAVRRPRQRDPRLPG